MSDCTSNDFAVMKFRFMAAMSMFTLCSWTVYFVAITFFPIPKENLPLVNTIVGFLILELGIMIGYYFGASQSSNAMKAKENEPPAPDEVKAKAEAARLEAERIEAAKREAEKKEAERLEAAKIEAARVIEAARDKEEPKP